MSSTPSPTPSGSQRSSIVVEGNKKTRRYTVTTKADAEDLRSASYPASAAPATPGGTVKGTASTGAAPPLGSLRSSKDEKLGRSFSLVNLFKKKPKEQPEEPSTPKDGSTSPSPSNSTPSPRVSSDSVRVKKELGFTYSEAKRINNKLDDLASKAMNPLLGMDSDDDDDDDDQANSAYGSPPQVSQVSIQQLALHFPDDTPEEKEILTRTINTLLKNALDPTKGWTKEMLAPVAALWYPPEMWARHSEAVFDNDKYLLPDEEMVEVLDRELKKVEALQNKKRSETKSLLQQDFQIDLELVDKEVKKRKDMIRNLEYKQWKLTTQIEKILEKTIKSSPVKVEQVVVLDRDMEGKPMKETRVKEGEHFVQSGTIDALVLSLFDELNQDVTFVDSFLLTYRMYLSSTELLEKISSLFEAGKIKKGSAVRVLLVVKKWIQRYWLVDFQLDKLAPRLNEFWIMLKPHVISSGQEDLSLVGRMAGTQVTHDQEAASVLLVSKKIEKRNFGDQSEENPWAFLSLSKSIEEFALMLASIEMKFYQGIRPEEFLEKLTWKGAADEVNPKTLNLFGLVNWVNQLGYWMATEICLCYDLKDRTKVLTRFIEIAKECARIGCYNTVFAIVTGLSNSSISRLKLTWQGLTKKIQTDFNELEDICNPQFNYKKYRKLEQTFQPPFIPFIGMHMRDMFFTNDGNPSKLQNGLMNFDKLRNLDKSIQYVLSLQSKTFYKSPVKDERLLEYIAHINSVEPLQERHLHKMSCQCEPPEWRKKSNFTRRPDDLL